MKIERIKKGQMVHVRADRLNPGEVSGSLMALEDSDWGRVRCVNVLVDLPIPPQETIRFTDIERISGSGDEAEEVNR